MLRAMGYTPYALAGACPAGVAACRCADDGLPLSAAVSNISSGYSAARRVDATSMRSSATLRACARIRPASAPRNCGRSDAPPEAMNALLANDSQMRPMKQADIDIVAAIEQRAYEFSWTPGIPRLPGAPAPVLVLEARAGIIGYGVLSCAAGEAHVLNVCVAPEHQGHGHGRRLMRRLIDLARWHMVDRVFLEVRPSNPKAIALYDSLASTKSAGDRTITRAKNAAGRRDGHRASSLP